MGIYDREYYKSEGPSFLDRIGLRGQVVKWLILINVLVFVLQMLTRRTDAVTDALVLDTAAVWRGEIWRLFTYAFLHSTADIWHILFNMLFLWWFGSDVEVLYGPREFLAFYLVAVLAGALAFQAQALAMGRPLLCLGASGAVTAVMVLCACHFPTRTILIFFVLPVPIWIFVAFQVLRDALVLIGGEQTGTAVAVHLGGAAFGFAYYKFQWRVLAWLPDLRGWRLRRARPRLRVYRGGDDEPQTPVLAAPRAATAQDMDEQLEAKLDAVLEKVARSGKESLTESEKLILQRASDMYRRRRT